MYITKDANNSSSSFSTKREAKDKVHVTCRSQAILLASILKAKGIPARARSGFAEYIHYDGICYDHWITEYFDEKENRWRLVDADEHCPDHEMGFDLNNIPYDKFLFSANAYLGVRQHKYKPKTILYASDPPTLGLKALIRGLFYDLHSLMNDEIIFLHMPKYIQDKKFELSEEEYKELDDLAKLMINPNENFSEIQEIWNNILLYVLFKLSIAFVVYMIFLISVENLKNTESTSKLSIQLCIAHGYLLFHFSSNSNKFV